MAGNEDLGKRIERLLAELRRKAGRGAGGKAGRDAPPPPPSPRRRRADYYFAYGSNMNEARANARIPGARALGRGVLRNYALRERLYADIAFAPGSTVEGVLYAVTARDMAALDRFEGAPRTYVRRRVPVVCGGWRFMCWAYVMTAEARARRAGRGFPAWYRAMCSDGAVRHGVRDDFGKGGRK